MYKHSPSSKTCRNCNVCGTSRIGAAISPGTGWAPARTGERVKHMSSTRSWATRVDRSDGPLLAKHSQKTSIA